MINVDSTIHDPTLSAEEAAELLGIKRETLYAYASRGQLRSLPGEGSRARRYLRSDVELLRARHDARAGHGPVAASALRWGEPVLDSAITGIDARGPRYRGHVAVELAANGVSFERVAELLWSGASGALPDAAVWQAPARVPASGVDASAPALLRLSALVPLLAHADPSPMPSTAPRELARARQLVATLARAVAPEPAAVPAEATLARALAVGLGVRPTPRVVAALDRALVLMADHELNASSFVARVTASTGADLYAVVSAALAALSGPAHGGACDRVEALLDEAGEPSRAAEVVRARGRRGEVVPGFSHRLYPDGDPRSAPVLADARALGPRRRSVATLLALAEATARTRGEKPAVDLALVALMEAIGAPRGSATVVFALGRTAGWIAHAMEQREAGFLLRPRARYVGP